MTKTNLRKSKWFAYYGPNTRYLADKCIDKSLIDMIMEDVTLEFPELEGCKFEKYTSGGHTIGDCAPMEKLIRLSPAASIECLSHELAHIIVRGHTPKFFETCERISTVIVPIVKGLL